MRTFRGVLSDVVLKVRNKVDEAGLSDSLADKYLWDIVTALRGPDASDSSALKKSFTGRVRAIVGITDSNRPRGLTVTPSAVELGDIEAGGSHFADHIKRTIVAIKAVYGVDLTVSSEAGIGVTYGRDEKEYLYAHTETAGGVKKYNLINMDSGCKFFLEGKTIEELDAKIEELEFEEQ